MDSELTVTQSDIDLDDPQTVGRDKILTEDFYLGEWRVRPLLNQLQQREGELTRHLEPRLAKLLCYLAAHEMQVVDRETLVSVLWPRVIVNENSLTRAVSELRKQLNTPDQTLVYIETIPKRGYRLCLPVEAVAVGCDSPNESSGAENSLPNNFEHTQFLPLYSQAKQSAVAALCLSLVLGAWLQFNDSTVETWSADQLADELVVSSDNKNFSDEVILSSSLTTEMDVESISPPVLSQDQDQFAYIQYDHTGSTLFLGQVSGAYEPVPVFNSVDILYNLAWSPVGNALLFASKPPLTTALFDKNLEQVSALYSFDLESFRLSKLVEKSPFEQTASEVTELSLT
ncbi:MAG: winged helix-turn-helix domain-containing protein [Pseudomonadales bacterium]|nr:winged helix-turn-helix domain-containing protein [Pseudomonadales bacterium]